MINQQLKGPIPRCWQQLRDLRFGNPARFLVEEKALETRGQCSLEGYLGYWARHSRDVLRQVPEDRLLVIEANRLADSVGLIAEFVGIPASTLSRQKAHSFKTRQRFDVLSQIDSRYLEETAQRICGEVAEVCAVRYGSNSQCKEYRA